MSGFECEQDEECHLEFYCRINVPQCSEVGAITLRFWPPGDMNQRFFGVAQWRFTEKLLFTENDEAEYVTQIHAAMPLKGSRRNVKSNAKEYSLKTQP